MLSLCYCGCTGTGGALSDTMNCLFCVTVDADSQCCLMWLFDFDHRIWHCIER